MKLKISAVVALTFSFANILAFGGPIFAGRNDAVLTVPASHSKETSNEYRFEDSLQENGVSITEPLLVHDEYKKLEQLTPYIAQRAIAANISLDKPDEDIAESLKELVALQETSTPLTKQEECLASTIYFESKSESLEGQLAVARVVLARAKSGRFPNKICDVVYQPYQFSFIKKGKMPKIDKAHRQWRNAISITKIAMAGGWESKVEGALFFHANYVSPRWKLKRMAAIGNHIFYRHY